MTFTSAQRQTLTWIALSAALAVLVWLLGPVLTPFIVAAVLAYVLHPLVERLARRRVPRVVAATIVEIVAIVIVLAVVLLIVPILSKQLPLLREQIPLLADRANTQLAPWLARFGIDVALDTASIKEFVLKYLNTNLEDWTATALSSARIGGSILLAVVGNAFLIPMVLFYLLMDWNNLVARIASLIPPRVRERTHSFIDECDSTLGQYLRGQLLVMVVLAAYYSAGLALFGVRSGRAGGRVHGPGGLHTVRGLRPGAGTRADLGGAAVHRLARADRRGGGVRRRAVVGELRADTAAGR